MRTQYKQAKSDKATIKLKEESTDDDIVEAEAMFKQALENRITLLESWQNFENEHGKPDSEAKKQLLLHLPKKVKKRKKVSLSAELSNLEHDTEEATTWEEFWDYIFPEEEEQTSSFKLLMMAKAWKENRTQNAQYDPEQKLEINQSKIMAIKSDVKESMGKMSWAQKLTDKDEEEKKNEEKNNQEFKETLTSKLQESIGTRSGGLTDDIDWKLRPRNKAHYPYGHRVAGHELLGLDKIIPIMPRENEPKSKMPRMDEDGEPVDYVPGDKPQEGEIDISEDEDSDEEVDEDGEAVAN